MSVLLLALPLVARSRGIVVIPRDQTVPGNLVRSGERVDVDGTVTGDAILIGSTLNVNGTIEGDLIALGQTLTVKGTVKGSVRALVADMSLEGPVGRNVTVAGAQVALGKPAEVQGSVAALAQRLRVDGTIHGSVDAVAAQATVGGTVARDVVIRNDVGVPGAGSGATTVAATAAVAGAFRHIGTPPATVAAGARVSGGVIERAVNAVPGRTVALRLTWIGLRFVALALLGLLCLRFFRGPAQTILEAMRGRPFGTFALGFAVLFLTPLAFILLAVTLIGAPIAVLLIVLYALALYVSRALVAVHLGRWLHRFGERRGIKLPAGDPAALLVGLLTLTVVLDLVLGWHYSGAARAMNIIGGLVNAALTLWTVGGFARGFWRTVRSQRPTATA